MSPVDRRSLLAGAMGLAAASLGATKASAQAASLDPVNPDIRYGAAGYIWGVDLPGAIADCRRLGLQGLEPYRQHIATTYASNPAPLKAMYDAAGLLMPTCSNGGAGQSTNFIDPTKTDQTIADHMKFVRDFLVPFGAPVFKINVGARPPGGPNDDQLKTMARTLDELGRQTAALGIRLAPHPHIWGPLERGPEVARVMELTNPRYVWLTTDTAHLTLGGMDAVKIIDSYFPRVAEVHLKDCDAKYRGNTDTPTRELHDKASVYKNLGVGGGVDFPAVFKVLRDRRFKGWVVLDLDPPRPGDGTGDIHDNLATNVNYLRNTLGVRLPAPRLNPPSAAASKRSGMSKPCSALIAALLSLTATAALAQSAEATPPGATNADEWTTWGYDQERSGWNRGEKTLSTANVGKLKVEWRTKLNTPVIDVVLSTLTAPVVAAGVQTPQGAKNLLYVLGADDVLTAMDADTGSTVWTKSYPNPLKPRKIATWLCSNTANATPTIDKAKGVIYFMASDGLLRGLNLADGVERLKPVEMVTPWARAWSLNLIDDVVYTTSGRACGEVLNPRSDWAMAMTPLTPRQIATRATSTEPVVDTDPSAVTGVDVSDPQNPTVTRYFTSGGRPAGAWGRGGLAKGPGNSLILETSDGIFDPGSGQWGDSVLKLAPKATRIQDSFTPENHAYILSKDLAGSASPVVFPFDGKTLVAQSQKESILYLLDANDMGGGKAGGHARPLFKSAQLGNDIAAGTDPSSGVWGAITTYLTPDGRRFLYVPMWGPPSVKAPNFPVSAGATPNGSIMAFEVVKRGDAIVAEARWMSNDMVMPDPPTVANGVLFATSTGGQAKQNPLGPDGKRLVATTPESIKQRSTPVDNLKLYAFDAVTGKQLYSSKQTIRNWVHFGEPVVALGKVYLVTNDAEVIAFGLGRKK